MMASWWSPFGQVPEISADVNHALGSEWGRRIGVERGHEWRLQPRRQRECSGWPRCAGLRDGGPGLIAHGR